MKWKVLTVLRPAGGLQSHALRYGAGCAIHLSKLDPKGYTRESGVTASGPVSFGKIYSTL